MQKPGDARQPRRVGIKDVAARAGVAIATVSRVLSGSAEVRPDLRERVLVAAAELDYQPDVLAQSLRRGATRSMGFVADDLANHTIADIATGAESVLRAHDHSLLVMNSELDPALDALNVRVLRSRRVDALMMCPVEEDDPATVATLRDLDIPLCIIEGDQPPTVRASYVHSDHRAGAVDALRHLVELGHTTIALVTGPPRYRSARQRLLALEDVAADAPPDVAFLHRHGELDADDGEAAMAELLALEPRPTAVVVGGVRILLGVLRAIEAAGLDLGRDISFVTTDPVSVAPVFRPPLASITRDSFGVGRRAAEALLERLADPTAAPTTSLLPTVYVPRASVGPAPRAPRRPRRVATEASARAS
jgi:LacI family transcriptional regulator